MVDTRPAESRRHVEYWKSHGAHGRFLGREICSQSHCRMIADSENICTLLTSEQLERTGLVQHYWLLLREKRLIAETRRRDVLPSSTRSPHAHPTSRQLEQRMIYPAYFQMIITPRSGSWLNTHETSASKPVLGSVMDNLTHGGGVIGRRSLSPNPKN